MTYQLRLYHLETAQVIMEVLLIAKRDLCTNDVTTKRFTHIVLSYYTTEMLIRHLTPSGPGID
jgi:hypothetical protein